jgi:sulfotransferase
MQNRLHFISGLPRAGSTLLAALLRQNPRFTAGMSSPVYALFRSMLIETSARSEGSVFIDNDIPASGCCSACSAPTTPRPQRAR